MSTNTGIPARSLYGCWTCRVRRKKCDESRPLCNTCNSLRLECHGYGPRPEWMDNGALQKERALEFKHIVSQRKWKKEKQRSFQPSCSSYDHNVRYNQVPVFQLDTHKTPPTSGPNSNNTHSSQPSCLTSEIRSNDESSELDLTAYLEQAWNAPSHNNIISSDALRNSGNCNPLTLNTEDVSSSHGPQMLVPDLPATQVSDMELADVAPQEILELAINGGNNADFDAMMWSTPQYNTSTLTAATAPNYPLSSHNLLANVATLPRPVPPETTTPEHQKEDALFMHYLDDVFYIQNPFYNPADKYKRAWLFSIIKKFKPAYYATLALSERDLLVASLSQDAAIGTLAERLRAKDGYYDLAVQGLNSFMEDVQTLQGHSDLVRCLEGLTSILQVLCWETFAGGSRNWQGLLRSASTLLPPLIEARMPGRTSTQSMTQRTNKRPLPPEQDGATCVLLGSFISLDILACASTRSTPCLKIDHIQALNNLGIATQRLMGCRSSVMSLIFEITVLDKWKVESRATHKLSIVDLAKRGLQIEHRLRQELEKLNSTRSSPNPSNGSSTIHSIPSHIIATKAYALSAIIYLHVVISGPYPELPEIAEPVSDAIELFKDVHDDPKLLLNVIWPLCVCGCMASESQRSFFRHLAASFTQRTTSGESLPTTGTFFEAMKIMEQCWHTRETLPFDCDWASIMDQSACYVLLR